MTFAQRLGLTNETGDISIGLYMTPKDAAMLAAVLFIGILAANVLTAKILKK